MDKTKTEYFEILNSFKTIGKLKEDRVKRYFKDKKLIGRFDVELLKEFIKKLPKDDYPVYIGVYIHKKGLAPLHCKRWVVAPRIYNKKTDNDKFGEV